MHERQKTTLELQQVLGMDGFIHLCECLGGTRVYISHKFSDDHDLVKAVGRELADKLSRRMAPATLRIPLGRTPRALKYRNEGLSDAAIARKLGITENGVAKLFKREPDLPDRPGSAKNGGQLSLF